MDNKLVDTLLSDLVLINGGESFDAGRAAFLRHLCDVPAEAYSETMFSFQFGREVYLLKNPSITQESGNPVLYWEKYSPKKDAPQGRIKAESGRFFIESARNIAGELEVRQIKEEQAQKERKRLAEIERIISNYSDNENTEGEESE